MSKNFGNYKGSEYFYKDGEDRNLGPEYPVEVTSSAGMSFFDETFVEREKAIEFVKDQGYNISDFDPHYWESIRRDKPKKTRLMREDEKFVLECWSISVK